SNSSPITAPPSGSTAPMPPVRSVCACHIPLIIPNSPRHELGLRNRCLSQDPRGLATQIENGRWLADLAGSTIEDEIEPLAQSLDDLVGVDRWRCPGRVRAAAGDRFTQGSQ